jgi:hypothetical protein
MEIDAMRQRVGWICHRKRIKRMGLRLRFRNVFAVAVLVVVAGMASCRRGVVAHPASGAGAAACSLEASATVAHAGDVVRIHVNAVFPRGFSLNYFWTSEAGTLRGERSGYVVEAEGCASGDACGDGAGGGWSRGGSDV